MVTGLQGGAQANQGLTQLANQGNLKNANTHLQNALIGQGNPTAVKATTKPKMNINHGSGLLPHGESKQVASASVLPSGGAKAHIMNTGQAALS